MTLNKISQILFLALIVGVVTAGIVLFLQKKSPAEKVTPLQVSTSTQSETTTQPTTQVTTSAQGEIDTSDWKTYVNEKYRFRFEYPNGYEVYTSYPPKADLGELGGVVTIARNLELVFGPGPKPEETLEKWVAFNFQLSDKNVISRETISVAGEKAIRVEFSCKKLSGEDTICEEIWLNRRFQEFLLSYTFRFKGDEKGISKELFYQIVSNFRFIK
jgi:hypothetical protein